MNSTGGLTAIAVFMLTVALLLAGAPTLAAQEGGGADEAAGAYEKAYNLILDERWEDAAGSLVSFLEKYTEDSWTDDARFWQCYSRAQLGESLEEVFSCYQRFIAEYPESKWKDDAETHMIAAARELARAGNAEYGAFVESKNKDADKEVALSAILALQAMGNEQALPALMNLLENEPDAAAREQIVFLLSRFDSPEAKARLIGLAKADPSSKIRGKALFWLAQGDEVTAGDIQAIVEIVNTDSETRVREHGVFALAQIEDHQGVEALLNFAKTHNDPAVREKAVFWLVQEGGFESGSVQVADIVNIVLKDSNRKVQQSALFALSQIPGEQGVDALAEIAQSHPESRMRKQAVNMLQRVGGEKAQEALLKIIGQEAK